MAAKLAVADFGIAVLLPRPDYLTRATAAPPSGWTKPVPRDHAGHHAGQVQARFAEMARRRLPADLAERLVAASDDPPRCAASASRWRSSCAELLDARRAGPALYTPQPLHPGARIYANLGLTAAR